MGDKKSSQETRSFSASNPTFESPQSQQLLGQFSALFPSFFGTRGPAVDAFQGVLDRPAISPQARQTVEAGNRALDVTLPQELAQARSLGFRRPSGVAQESINDSLLRNRTLRNLQGQQTLLGQENLGVQQQLQAGDALSRIFGQELFGGSQLLGLLGGRETTSEGETEVREPGITPQGALNAALTAAAIFGGA